MAIVSRALSSFGTYKTTQVTVVAIIFVILATLTVLGRFASRRLRKATFGIDDWLMVAGLMCYYGQVACTFIMTIQGGVGRHLHTLSEKDIATLLKVTTVVQFPYGFAMAFIRCSICALLIRIFFTRTFRHVAFILIGINVAWCMFVVFAAAFVCRPFRFNWDKTIDGGHCGNQRAIYEGIAAWGLVLDGVMWALPFPMVWKLHLPMWQRVAISSIFALGVLDMIAGIFRIITILAVNFEGDLSIDVVKGIIWGISEPGIAILVGCGPILRPLVQKMIPAKLTTLSQSIRQRSKQSTTDPTNAKSSKAYGKISEDQIELTLPQDHLHGASEVTVVSNGDVPNTMPHAKNAKGSNGDGIGVQHEFIVSRA